MNRSPLLLPPLSMRSLSMRPLTLLLAAAAAVFALTSCDSILDVEPTDAASSESALQGRNGYSALLNSAYDRLQNPVWKSSQFMLEPEAQADNITVTNDNTNRYVNPVSITNQSYLGTSDGFGTLWGQAYDLINDVNNIIASIDGAEISPGADGESPQAFRDRIKGQAYFLRALSYFDLMRTYSYEPDDSENNINSAIKDVQGVILRTQPSTDVEGAARQLPRAPIDEVYSQIISDLDSSAVLLEGANVGSRPYKANRTAAQALLSRVHLYAKNYEQAEAAATAALENAPGGEDLSSIDYVDAFLADTNPEAIFALDMTTGQDGGATDTDQALASLTIPGRFAFEAIPSQDGVVSGGELALDQDNPETNDLIGAFNAEEDERFDLFAIGNKGPQELLYTRKWLDTENAFVTDPTLLRTAELYLNRAEARYYQGNTSGAQDDVNEIRGRAGLDETSATGSDLLDEILLQRRLEFNMEGHRWFDLKRRAQDIPKPQDLSPRPVIPYEDQVLLAPIPNNEVISNPNLNQNPGY